MRILVLTFYYPPDISAGAFRMKPFVASLVDSLSAGSQVDVVTTMPNRYHTFSPDAPDGECSSAVRVHRIPIPTHRSGMFDQTRSFGTFARRALRLTRSRSYDLVFATSSRLMTAVLGSSIARQQNATLYLDIRDIFAETIGEVLPIPAAWAVKCPLSILERFALRQASRINLVSEGFRGYFSDVHPGGSYSVIPNGVDDEFVEADWESGGPYGGSVLTVLYAGNIGEGQGLHTILPAIARSLENEVVFRIIGDGGRRLVLENTLRDSGVTNVNVLPPVTREALIAEYRRADVLFLHLNDHHAFRRVLPSKVFEYAATGKPIWAGVAGYAASFLQGHVSNVGVFAPGDATAALDIWRLLNLERVPRTDFNRRFSRRAMSAALAQDVLTLLPSNS